MIPRFHISPMRATAAVPSFFLGNESFAEPFHAHGLQEDMLGEGEVDRSGDARAALSTTEKTRIALASSVARQALDIIIQDCSGGTVI